MPTIRLLASALALLLASASLAQDAPPPVAAPVAQEAVCEQPACEQPGGEPPAPEEPLTWEQLNRDPFQGDGPDLETSWAPKPRFFITAELLLLDLASGVRPAVPVAVDPPTGAAVLAPQDLDYHPAAGPRITFGYRLDERTTIEASIIGPVQWNAESPGSNRR